MNLTTTITTTINYDDSENVEREVHGHFDEVKGAVSAELTSSALTPPAPVVVEEQPTIGIALGTPPARPLPEDQQVIDQLCPTRGPSRFVLEALLTFPYRIWTRDELRLAGGKNTGSGRCCTSVVTESYQILRAMGYSGDRKGMKGPSATFMVWGSPLAELVDKFVNMADHQTRVASSRSRKMTPA